MAADYYEVLGVDRNVDAAELKKVYRRFAMKYHPDRNPDNKTAEQKFKEVKKAYETLSDPQKRAAYDQFGEDGVNNMGGMGGGFQGSGFGGINDIFEDIFGGDVFSQQRRSSAQRGEHYEYRIELSLKEAAYGLVKQLEIEMPVSCDACKGSGAKPGTKPKTCPSCHGSGHQSFKQGFFTMQQTCGTCRGEGQIIGESCHTCSGSGQVNKKKTLEVTIPAGVDTGDRIRLAGEGGVGFKGGPAGDLYLIIRVKPHHLIKRKGADLLLDVPISFATTALGGEVEVPTLDNRLKLKIPAGTQTGEQLRIRGKGVKMVRGGKIGDMICKIQVETPVNLTLQQKELLRKFESSLESGGQKHSPKKHSWFTSIKNFFSEMGLI